MGPHLRRRAGRLSRLQGQAPVIVVYSLAQAIAALTAATEAGQPVVVISAPDAGIYAGSGWFKALVDAARAAAPAASFLAILDCGDDAGAAQGALRAGIAAVIFAGRTDVAERLRGIAEAKGARILTSRPAASLDLAADFFADQEMVRRRCATVFATYSRDMQD